MHQMKLNFKPKLQCVASARAGRFRQIASKINHRLVGLYGSYLLPKLVLGTHEEQG